MCHVRCTSDDCPPRTDHFGVHDGHVHVWTVHIACSDAPEIVIDWHESKTNAIADTNSTSRSFPLMMQGNEFHHQNGV